jgi:hypothetical protein
MEEENKVEEVETTETTETTESKTFTQDDLNAKIGKAKKDAKTSLLKQLGVDDFDSVKDGLAKLKELEEANKTELEKALEKAGQVDELSGKLSDKDLRIEALKKGVDPEKLEKFVKLAKIDDGETLEEKIQNTLNDFNGFSKKEEKKEVVSFGGESESSTLSPEDKIKAEMSAIFGV